MKRSKFFRQSLSIAIVILLVVPFQLALAAPEEEPVSLLIRSGKLEPAEQAIFRMLQKNRLASRVVGETDFIAAMHIQKLPYLAVPLYSRTDEATVAALAQYIAGGGKLLLLPAVPAAELRGNKLLELVGIPVSGFKMVDGDVQLHWKGQAEPEWRLPAQSSFLTITPKSNMEILASWNNEYPAVVQTPYGLLLNWQWDGQGEPDYTNVLARLLRLPNPEEQTKPTESVAAQESASTAANGEKLEASEPQKSERAPQPVPGSAIMVLKKASPSESQPSEKLAEVESPEVAQPASTAAEQANAPDKEPSTPVAIAPLENEVQEAVEPEKAQENQTTAPMEKKTPDSESFETKPVATQSSVETPPSGTKLAATEAKPPVETAIGDDEVLNNILGVPNNSQPASGQPAPQAPQERRQKPFSFLDPDASEILAPKFDYGVYSMSMRILDDYKKRINDALETSRQLALNVPEEQVLSLLRESDVYKKQFETLYLANKTQEGLDAFAQARKLALQALALTTDSPRVEGRAIWLDRGTIVKAGGPAGVRLLMQRLHQAGINVVYFEAFNAGFPLYQSAILKPNPLVMGWDPLQAAVEEGHRLGMEVHAWVWVFAVGNRKHNDLIGKPSNYAGPVLEDLGLMSEALRGRDGSLNMDIRQNEFWLSPASPKAREFLLSAYKELLTKYPVDGLHLDYIRYPFQTSGTRMGFESVAKERFAQSTGMNLDTLDDYTQRMWIAWKTYQVSSFVQQVSEMARKLRPMIKISAAVFPMKRDARIVAIQQDWETWVDNGWIDVLNPMSYTSDPERLQSIYETVQRSPQRNMLVYPGIALKYLDGGSLVNQLEALRQKGCMGTTLFAGAYLDGEKIDTLGKGPYKNSSSLPPHRDVIQAIQLLSADYEQKLARLQTGRQIGLADANSVQSALKELAASLAAFQSAPSSDSLQRTQQAMRNLQSVTQSWSNQDRAAHPYRAAHFDKLVTQLDKLVGYLADKAIPPTTAESFEPFRKAGTQPVPPAKAAPESASEVGAVTP
jgi:uncharacterized lipoprotein YddW (UPF0748 family)